MEEERRVKLLSLRDNFIQLRERNKIFESCVLGNRYSDLFDYVNTLSWKLSGAHEAIALCEYTRNTSVGIARQVEVLTMNTTFELSRGHAVYLLTHYKLSQSLLDKFYFEPLLALIESILSSLGFQRAHTSTITRARKVDLYHKFCVWSEWKRV